MAAVGPNAIQQSAIAAGASAPGIPSVPQPQPAFWAKPRNGRGRSVAINSSGAASKSVAAADASAAWARLGGKIAQAIPAAPRSAAARVRRAILIESPSDETLVATGPPGG
jgi:hypothetical protein